VIDSPSVNAFKNCFDKHWKDRGILLAEILDGNPEIYNRMSIPDEQLKRV